MKKISFLIFIFIPFLCFSQTSFQIVKIDSSKLPEIKLFTSIKKHNTAIQAHSKNDFKLYFNAKEKDFDLKVSKKQISISVLILIDASLSINRATRRRMRNSAKKIVSGLRKNDRAALFIFNDSLFKLSGFTKDKEKLNTLIDKFKPAGRYSRLYDSISKTQEYINEQIKGGRKAIVLFSDGLDEKSRFTLNKAIKHAKEGRIPVYSYGYTNINTKYLDSLKKMSAETEGKYSFEDKYNFLKALIPEERETFYEMHFSIDDFKRVNYITLRNEKINKQVRVKLVINKDEITKLKEKQKRSRILKYIIFGIILLLILIALFMLLKKKKRKTKEVFKSSLIKTEKEKKKALENKKVQLEDDEKWLVTKAVLSQINNDRAKVITLYKEIFSKNQIGPDEFNAFTDTIEQFYNSTSALTFSEIKKLENIIRDFRAISNQKNFAINIDNLIAEDRLERIKTTLIHKKVLNDVEDEPKRVTDSVPMLKEVFRTFESEQEKTGVDGVYDLELFESDDEFDLILETFLLGNSMGGADNLIRDIYELDDEKIAQLIPFMITVVKDSEGFERDFNINILKRMAQSLNLNIDNLSDVSDFENWWKENKQQIIKNVKHKKKADSKVELENGFFTQESITFYSIFDGALTEFSGIIKGGDKYSIIISSANKARLDDVICFYRPDLPFSDNVLRINEYTFTRLVEIEKIENGSYSLNLYFVHPNNRKDEEINDLTSLLFKE